MKTAMLMLATAAVAVASIAATVSAQDAHKLLTAQEIKWGPGPASIPPGVQVAVITRRPQGYFITHVEGAVMPVLNGKTLDAQAHALNDHDVIELAGVKMEFFFKT